MVLCLINNRKFTCILLFHFSSQISWPYASLREYFGHHYFVAFYRFIVGAASHLTLSPLTPRSPSSSHLQLAERLPDNALQWSSIWDVFTKCQKTPFICFIHIRHRRKGRCSLHWITKYHTCSTVWQLKWYSPTSLPLSRYWIAALHRSQLLCPGRGMSEHDRKDKYFNCGKKMRKHICCYS
jgi:hypothetical protein